MKKPIITIMSALLITVGSAQAQEQQSDTTQRQTKQRAESGESDASQQTDMARQPRMQQGDQLENNRYNSGEMVIVQHNEIPESLRQTLEDEKYKGWEDAIIYHNTRTGEYLISPRPHRFSSEGKPIEYTGQSGQQRMEGQQRRPQQQGERDQSRDEATSRDRQSPTDPNRQLDQNNDPTGQQEQNTARQSEQQGQTDQQRQSGQETRAGQTDPQQSNAYRTDRKDAEEISTTGMTLVQRDQYPASLRETLKESQYEGWERGKLYEDPSTEGYVLVIDDNEKNSSAKRYYRFDKDGKETTGETSSGMNNDDQ